MGGLLGLVIRLAQIVITTSDAVAAFVRKPKRTTLEWTEAKPDIESPADFAITSVSIADPKTYYLITSESDAETFRVTWFLMGEDGTPLMMETNLPTVDVARAKVQAIETEYLSGR